MIERIVLGLITGVLFGFILQRGRFCMTSAYRDVYLSKDNTLFLASFVAIAVQSIGIFLLKDLGYLKIPAIPFTWLAAIVGGFVFGVGIILAGGCASGSWYRAGEGLVGSWMALIGYMFGSATIKFGALLQLNNLLTKPKLKEVTIYQTLHVSPWVLIVVMALIVGFFVARYLKRSKSIVTFTMKPKKTGLAHILFEKRWNPMLTGLLVGLVAILAWIMSEATGRMDGLGITTPTGHLLEFLVTGKTSSLDWGVFLVLGIAIGSYIAAKGSGEFKLRAPAPEVLVRHLIGGILMGFGAGVASGCNIGNGLVRMSMFAWNGWLATPFIILGTWFGAYIWLVRPTRKVQRQSGQQVSQSA